MLRLPRFSTFDGRDAKVIHIDTRSYTGSGHVWHVSYEQFPRVLLTQIFLSWYEQELAESYYRETVANYVHGIVNSLKGLLLVVFGGEQKWCYSRNGNIVVDQDAVRSWDDSFPLV